MQATERRAWKGEAHSRTAPTLSLVLDWALAFFSDVCFQKLSLQAAPSHGPVASLWKACLSVALAGLNSISRNVIDGTEELFEPPQNGLWQGWL